MEKTAYDMIKTSQDLLIKASVLDSNDLGGRQAPTLPPPTATTPATARRQSCRRPKPGNGNDGLRLRLSLGRVHQSLALGMT